MKPTNRASSSIADVLDQRRQRRERSLDLARRYAETLPANLEVSAVIVFGSVARGDFNVWSDTDLLIVAPDLPATFDERMDLLPQAPPGIQVFVWTPEEYLRELKRGNRIARDCVISGVLVAGALPGVPPLADQL